jgi:hypothetical protein
VQTQQLKINTVMGLSCQISSWQIVRHPFFFLWAVRHPFKSNCIFIYWYLISPKIRIIVRRGQLVLYIHPRYNYYNNELINAILFWITIIVSLCEIFTLLMTNFDLKIRMNTSCEIQSKNQNEHIFQLYFSLQNYNT